MTRIVTLTNEDRMYIANLKQDWSELKKELASRLEKSSERIWFAKTRFYRPRYWMPNNDGFRIVDKWIVFESEEQAFDYVSTMYHWCRENVPDTVVDAVPNVPFDGMILIHGEDVHDNSSVFELQISIQSIQK